MTNNLLPHYWKKLALGIFLLALIIWLTNLAKPELFGIDPFLMSQTLELVILTSLLILALSKEKIETPRNSGLRLDSLFTALTAGGFLLITEFFMEILFQGDDAEITSGYELMIMVLVVYSLTFFIKRNIKTVKA